jgi:predicted phosphodiesterase
MEPIALISDIHGNIEALLAVLEDIKKKGIKRVYILGDEVNYGPDSGKVIDHVRELCLPEERKTIEVVRGLAAELVLEGNHDRTLEAMVRGSDAKYGMNPGPYAAMRIVHDSLFTSDPNANLADERRDELLVKGGTLIPKSYEEFVDEATDRCARKAIKTMPGRLRKSPGNLEKWFRESVSGFFKGEGANMIANEDPDMPKSDPDGADSEVQSYDKARERLAFVKGFAKMPKKGMVKDHGIHCFHGSWDKKNPYVYVLDPYQVAVFQQIESVPTYLNPESAINMAKSLRQKEPIMLAHGHTHVPGIFKKQKDGFEIVVIDTGSVGMPRSEGWVGFDYGADRQIEEHDCHTKASYVVVDEKGPRVEWARYDFEKTYDKMKVLYGWDRLSPKEKRPLTFMKLWSSIKGEWPQAA